MLWPRAFPIDVESITEIRDLLTIVDIHKRFGRKVVLAGATLTAKPSEIIVVTGKNGSGKSTLLRMICGIVEPTRGEIEICGHSLRAEPQRAKAMLGYVPDGMEALPDLLSSEFIALVRALKPAPSGKPTPLDEAWKERLGIGAFWEQRLGALSFGQRKRLALLAALCGSPRLLLLDEPTNGLDTQGVELVRTLLHERRAAGTVTLLATNDLPFVSDLRARHYQISDATLTEAHALDAPPEPPRVRHEP